MSKYLESKWIVRSLGSRETAAVRVKFLDLASLVVNLADGLDGIEMIHARVDADFVQDGDTGLLGGTIELMHGGRDIASCHDIGLPLDGRADDVGMIDERDEGDDDVVVRDLAVEIRGLDVQGDGGGARESGC